MSCLYVCTSSMYSEYSFMLLYFDIYNLQIIKIKTVNLWIDFLDELGNFKQKKNYTFDFYTLQIFRVKQHSLSICYRILVRFEFEKLA